MSFIFFPKLYHVTSIRLRFNSGTFYFSSDHHRCTAIIAAGHQEITVIAGEAAIITAETVIIEGETHIIKEETAIIKGDTSIIEEETVIIEGETAIITG